MSKLLRVPFAAAVSRDEKARPRFLGISLVNRFTSAAIGKWDMASLAPGWGVISNGLGCFAAVTTSGCTSQQVVVGDRKPREPPQFLWVGHRAGRPQDHAGWRAPRAEISQAHLPTLGSVLAYPFDRRFDLRGLVSRLIADASRCAAAPKLLIAG